MHDEPQRGFYVGSVVAHIVFIVPAGPGARGQGRQAKLVRVRKSHGQSEKK